MGVRYSIPYSIYIYIYFLGGGEEIFYEEEGNGLEYRQSNINKHRKTQLLGFEVGLRCHQIDW